MKLDGRRALASMDSAIRDLRETLKVSGRRLEQLRQDQLRAENDRAAAYRELAQLKLDEDELESLEPGFAQLHDRVEALLAERAKALEEVERELAETAEHETALELQRQKATTEAAKATSELDQCLASAEAALAEDSVFQSQLAAIEEAEAVAAHAEQKTLQAQSDRVEKGKPYEAEPLFMYLWNRGYGTDGYRAGPVTRFLDDWVARIADFHSARPNYARLTEIPVRLAAHAEQCRDRVEAAQARADATERETAKQHGAENARAALDAALEARERIDAEIVEAEARYRNLSSRRSVFTQGTDEHYRQAIDLVAEQLARQPLPELRRQANRTLTPEDDRIVRHLAAVEATESDLDLQIQAEQSAQEHHRARIEELRAVRTKFKHRQFDAGNSVFRNADQFGGALTDLIGGVLSSRQFWRFVLNNQGFARPRTGNVFAPKRRRNRSVWRNSGLGRRRGGGGFRTGGGF